jgi:ribosomal protein L11
MHQFDAALHRLEGKIAWTVFYVPFSVPDIYGTNGRLNVKTIIDGHAFKGTLLPSKNGHYLAFNKEMKEACKKNIGDSVHVVLEKDDETRTVEIPDSIKEVLENNPGAMEAFQKLPDYIKREEINRIASAKQQQTIEKRLNELVGKLLK